MATMTKIKPMTFKLTDNNLTDLPWDEVPDVSDLENGTASPVTYRGHAVFQAYQDLLLLKGGLLHPLKPVWQSHLALDESQVVLVVTPAGARLRDGNSEWSIDIGHTLSFRCLSRFFSKKDDGDPLLAARLLAAGTLKVVDASDDVWRELTVAERRKYDAGRLKDLKPLELGFTIVQGQWHKPGGVLLRDTRKNGKTYYLGQDEGTYFGVELPGHPTTISAALDSLMPKAIRKLAGVKRQGEWFAVPTDEKKVPGVEECITTSATLALPLDHPDSNPHHIHNSDIRVARDGTIYAFEGYVEHRDHADLELPLYTWVYFVKNTAIRAFSEEGVD